MCHLCIVINVGLPSNCVSSQSKEEVYVLEYKTIIQEAAMVGLSRVNLLILRDWATIYVW